jgi:sarcosine oxidase
MMKTAYEFVVVGLGGIGSAALYWLARAAGSEVLGLEQFHLGHDNGASQDHSRIIRLSYHAPEYTALTPHAYPAWKAAEDESGVQIVVKCGGVGLVDEQGKHFWSYDSPAVTECCPTCNGHGLVPAESLKGQHPRR